MGGCAGRQVGRNTYNDGLQTFQTIVSSKLSTEQLSWRWCGGVDDDYDAHNEDHIYVYPRHMYPRS